MSTSHRAAARPLTLATLATLFLALLPVTSVSADTTAQTMPFSQAWTNTGLITASDDWNGVPGIVGYRGDELTAVTAADPQTILAEGTPVSDVNANQTSPDTFTTGGVAEFHLTDPVVALQGSGTADAPHLTLALSTTGATAVIVSYNLRDIDGSIDNAVTPVALQYRVGSTGDFTNVPAGFVADATSGPSLASLVTPVSVTLPAAANDQPLVNIRIITTNAVGSDEWVGVDDLTVTETVPESAPTVSSVTPANGATDVARNASLAVTFLEPVNVTASAFDLTCTSSGAHTLTVGGGPSSFTLDPDQDFAASETCTLTVVAAQVSDQDSDDPPDVMAADFVASFTTADACGETATLIHEVQGSGASSPVTGSVVTVEGVVVGDYQQAGGFSGYFVQEEDADADANPMTSEGIFVFNTSTAVAVGDQVRVRGTVTEFNSSGTVLTELAAVSQVLICSSGNALPAATAVQLPVAAVADLERHEGMLVDFGQELTVTETFTLARFGEVALSVGGRLLNPTSIAAPGAPALAQQSLNDRSRILLDDGDNRQNIDPTKYPAGGLSASNTLRSGDTLPDGVTGVLDQRFGVYRLQPVGAIDFTATNERPAAPEDVDGDVRIAAFNVLNYFNGDGLGGGFPTSRGATTSVELDRQRAKIVSAIVGLDADVLGLMELENDDPATEYSAIEDLVDGLNAATAPGTYAFIDTGVVGEDEIRVGLLYQPATVAPLGAHAILDSTVDPDFLDDYNRPVIAQSFEASADGARFTVLVNHLKSKGSDCNAVGDPDIGDGQGNCNLTRLAAAEAMVDWIATDPTGSGDDDVLIIGDLNSYAQEDPISALKTGGFTNLVESRLGADAYSYVFGGQSGYLDHALASESLDDQVSGVSVWHINADEPTALDYNVEFKSVAQIASFYAPDAYRSSDHDPILVGIAAASDVPTVDAGGPYLVEELGSVLLTATGSDPTGDDVTYDWDLDNDGVFETLGQSATFSAGSRQAPQTVTVTVRITDEHGQSSTDTATIDVIWDFGGFQPPVIPGVTVVKAGSTLPVKFSLTGDQGMDVLDGVPMVQRWNCTTAAVIGSPFAAAESEPFSYDPFTDEYKFAWKTQKGWAKSCATLTVALTDGQDYELDVRFTK